MSHASAFGLYIHWPFCVSKCPYCDFNSHVASHIDQTQWQNAYLCELQRVYEESSDRQLSSIFFGGGTPSLMPAQTVETILQTAQNLWGFRDGMEITLEANPTTVETDTFPNFKAAGINRLSIGIQSLRPEVLTFLGRAHSREDGLHALKLAQQTFERYSFDLIYARPDQTLDDWKDELTQALSLSGGHLSLYQLTIEPGTAFYKNKVPAIDEERGADLYDLTQEIMENAGLPAYEISNHAYPGQESRHNLIYWQGDDYIGIGPGAHSRLKNQAIHQIYKPDLWLEAVTQKKSGEQKRKRISTDDRAIELIMMGLRLNQGIDKSKFCSIIGEDIHSSIDEGGLNMLMDHKLIEWKESHLRATEEGRKCLNGVIEKLIKL
ncbi:radical SAM family heme chaperone HemW [Terasakiella sp. SH-1]|uniref:radical SAM family heme chaperone HemW n=1 Tax=Terasakiella sp. SH-1 TaxID=2560057 RepID=UPI001072F0A2|nr:radical SAM family heme chaperone HemW [Terasakiella sp. SH-1]